MDEPTAAETALTNNLAGPKGVTVDGVQVEQYDIQALIEADRYLTSKRAIQNGLGIRINRVSPPGAV